METDAADIALFDLDGSLADYDGALVRDLEALRGPDEPPVTRETLWQSELQVHMLARMRLIKAQPGWWLSLAPIQMGMDVLALCERLGFAVHVLTKGPKRYAMAWDEKVRWCQEHIGPDVDIHISSDKGMVYGKLMYDDCSDYMLRWLRHRPRGLGIMPAAPHNRDFSHPNVIKWDGTNLDEVTRAIRVAKSRTPGEPLMLK
jgi:5'-nucleotidase